MRLIRRLINLFKRNAPDPAEVLEEVWETDFVREKQRRFLPADEGTYAARFEDSSLVLELKKNHLFAWVEDPLYIYRDFVLEGEVSIDGENGHSSAGFIFRCSSEDFYYYFLVSSRGYFRFDAVFNGTPMPLIDWTPCPEIKRQGLPLRIVASGTNFVFCIDDVAVAEIEDDKIEAGGIAFAAQNYGEKPTALFYLHWIILDSLPPHVLSSYYRWKNLYPMPAKYRLELARSLFRGGQLAAAAVQFKKAASKRELPAEDELLFTECYVGLGLYESALERVEAALSKNQDLRDGIVAKADLLYSLGRMLDLRDFVRPHIEKFTEEPILWNLLGNAEYSLGNIEAAAEAYEYALRLEPEVPHFSLNLARCYERSQKPGQGVSTYLDAARLFFRQERYDELLPVLMAVETLDPENLEGKALRGKLLFQDEQFAEADRLFRELIDAGAEDASIYYLTALICLQEGRTQEAVSLLEKTVRLEPDYYLYWFKLGEVQFSLGKDPHEAVNKALECAPADQWVCNLAGLVYEAEGKTDEAIRMFQEARKAAPDNIDIIINQSQALYRSGNIEGAFRILADPAREDFRIYNHRGNLYSGLGQYEKAAAEYEQALRLAPEDRDILQNIAAVSIELDMLSRAEELLGKALELGPMPSVYNLMGNVTFLMGQFERAEAAYREGLSLEPENLLLRLNYADFLYQRGKYDEAAAVLAARPDKEKETERERELKQKIRDAAEVEIYCALCNRTWRVARNIEPQRLRRFQGEPPEESPAGRCPECGKVYCVACAKAYLEKGRFMCPECNKALKLSDDYLIYLVSMHISV